MYSLLWDFQTEERDTKLPARRQHLVVLALAQWVYIRRLRPQAQQADRSFLYLLLVPLSTLASLSPLYGSIHSNWAVCYRVKTESSMHTDTDYAIFPSRCFGRTFTTSQIMLFIMCLVPSTYTHLIFAKIP